MKSLRFQLDAQGRRAAKRAIDTAPVGMVCEIKAESKSREQEKRYHAMLSDLAEQWLFCGRRWDAEDMKRLCLDQFRRDTVKDPDLAELWRGMGQVDMAPSLDGSGVVALGIQSRRLPKKLATAFVDWLFALGAEHDIRWSDPTVPPDEVYERGAA